MARRNLITCVLATAIVTCGLIPVEARKPKSDPSSCPVPGQCATPEQADVLDREARALMEKIARNPSLMNLDYLQYFIGRPSNERGQHGKLAPHYTWFDEEHKVRYELSQQQSAPGQVVDSLMTFHLRGMGLDLMVLDKLYGDTSRKYYDFKGHPNKMFTFAPDTYISFSSPPNTFRVTEAKVMYRGQPLPPPSLAEMQLAQSSLLARASTKRANGEHDPELVQMLQERVKLTPSDPEAHLHLAESLQRQARIHEAIGEYKLALALSGSNQDVRMRSVEALRALKLLPPDVEPPRRNLEIVQNGQRIKVDGNERAANGNP